MSFSINQKLFTVTSQIVVSTSKNSSLKINATFDENFQIFAPYFAGPFKVGPINAA